jgi:GNAT superfamily N-acetyltransferase
MTIRSAVPADVPTILGFVRELAEYEKLSHEVVATEALMRAALFGPNPRAFAMICEAEGKSVGFALCFYNFSTFLGRPGIYLEDLYVQPAYRGHGLGRAALKKIAQRAKAEGCGRVEWSVLNWNQPAIDFYRALGSVAMDDWHIERLTGEALDSLAA